MAELESPVLIVGGGPCGLTTSIVLGRLGVPSLLVQRHPGTLFHPKAIGVMQRTAELLRQWGAETEMRARGVPDAWCYQMIWTTGLAGEELGRTATPDPDADLSDPPSPTRGLRCPQNITEEVLRGRAEAAPAATLRFGAEMTRFVQDADGVTATVRDRASGQGQMVRASYLVAADGAASGVRSACGIGVSGDADMGHFINIFLRAPLAPYVKDRPAWSYSVMAPPTFGAFVTINGDDLWVFHLNLAPGEQPEDYTEARCIDLLRHAAGAPDLPVEIISVRPWTMGAQIADRFRDRRVLLTGDAAHRTTPDGGVGMNTGAQSAHNLAWKVGAVAAGWAEPALLDTYEVERRPVAALHLGFSADRAHGLCAIAEAVAAGDLAGARALVGRRASTPTRQGMDLGYTYETGALLPDGSPPPARADPVRDYVPNARPGSRAPHLWLKRDGERVSTLDLVDDAPVLLTGIGGAAWHEAARAVAAGGVPLRALAVGARGDLVADEAQWRELYGVEADGAVLVRPDGFVAWRARSLADDPHAALGRGIAAVTGRA